MNFDNYPSSLLRGAAWLDVHAPTDWFYTVDVGPSFDMDLSDHCIITQLFGDYEDTMSTYRIEGFKYAFDRYTQDWTQYILARRREAGEPSIAGRFNTPAPSPASEQMFEVGYILTVGSISHNLSSSVALGGLSAHLGALIANPAITLTAVEIPEVSK